MLKFFLQKTLKKLSSQIFFKKIKMRALWSQVKKHDFFDFLGRPFSKMDILKMSKIDLPNFKKSNFRHFLPFIILERLP